MKKFLTKSEEYQLMWESHIKEDVNEIHPANKYMDELRKYIKEAIRAANNLQPFPWDESDLLTHFKAQNAVEQIKNEYNKELDRSRYGGDDNPW
jgi:hypothetical protein